MSNESCTFLLDEELISSIAEKVIEKLLNYQKQILVIYAGGNVAFNEGLDSLYRLKEEGCEFTILISKAELKMLPMKDIESKLNPKIIITELSTDIIDEFLKEFNLVIIPSLTINAVANLSQGISNSMITSIILECLMQNKNIIAAIDSCCPINLQKVLPKYNMAKVLEKKLLDNMEALRSYGIQLTFAKNIYKNTIKKFNINYKHSLNQVEYKFDEKVLNGNFVKVLPANVTIKISKQTLVTHLAKDEANKRSIKILQS